MESKRILVVDDEMDLCDILRFNLMTQGYQADVAYSAEEAMNKLKDERFDLLLLDVMMPGMSGFELAASLRNDEATAHIPIIFLTAKDTEDDTLEGFGLGADDYVTKPFSVREVMARVKAVLNRSMSQSHQLKGKLEYKGLVMDLDQKMVVVDGETVLLTKTEYELLSLLLSHQGQVFSREQLIEEVWPKDVIVSSRAVDVNITRMRKKIGRYSACVVTRQGYGYLFSV